MLQYDRCELCPRKCGVNRLQGQRGFCAMPAHPRLARAALHYGEEPPIGGAFGAGAVFFSGCTLRCKYCQNYEISLGAWGEDVSPAKLRELFLRLVDEGAQCIDLVTPTHFLPDIIPALSPKLPIPVVFNCGGYERVETLRELEGLVDIYLPDFKYSDSALAKELSDAPDYPEIAEAALREMFRQVGKPVIRDEIMERGVIVRHLALPDHVDNSLGVIDRLAEIFRPNDILISLMCQYVPAGPLANTPPFNRTVTEEEYAAVQSWLELSGFTQGFVQDLSAADTAQIPRFDGTGINF
ncbi:MAG: radical SAM protein [Oscillospiraceae bacterium]|nr:radical SAM protein [Oscillospiraceae bacterium]